MTQGRGGVDREGDHESRTGLSSSLPILLGAGAGAGTIIAGADNFLFEGEVSPIVILAMLLAATITAGWLWGWRGGIPSALAWICLPLAHLVKHLMGLPDTLQPNTIASILMLAVVTAMVALIGTGGGVLLRRATGDGAEKNP
jgi:hypothetical protein